MQTFVTQVREVARAEAREMIDRALSGTNGAAHTNTRFGAAGTVGVARSGRIKRSGEELQKMSEVLVSFVSKHPGLRIEQINKQLGTTTKELSLPIRKLTADGVLKAKGVRRATAYYVGGGEAESGNGKAKKSGKKKSN